MGEIADVFSIGVVIFSLVIGFFPFSEAKKDEYYFSMIYNRKWESYWQAFREKKPPHPVISQ